MSTKTFESHARGIRGLGGGFLLKLALMALVNAFGVMTVMSAWSAQSWVVLGVVVLLVVIADWVYFTRRALPLKYLLPGLIFLLVFQVFIFGYTAYIAFTNYGTGHVGTQEQAVEAALIQGERRVDDSPDYPLAVVERGDELGFAIVDGDGDVRVGSAAQP
ncbi:MAG TPA: maltose ABC transporter permease, partial [Microbacterium sp.]|nr:maltose ABC transporter permease [Microbacterium sp.]